MRGRTTDEVITRQIRYSSARLSTEHTLQCASFGLWRLASVNFWLSAAADFFFSPRCPRRRLLYNFSRVVSFFFSSLFSVCCFVFWYFCYDFPSENKKRRTRRRRGRIHHNSQNAKKMKEKKETTQELEKVSHLRATDHITE